MKSTHLPDNLTPQALAKIVAQRGETCLSVYQATHRSHPDNQQDPIRFRQLVKTLASSMEIQHSHEDIKELLAPFEALAADHDFWMHTQGGLAVLGAKDSFHVFLLQRPVSELAVVADSFHTKPLRQVLQSAGRYQVLALSLSKVQLYEGDRDALDFVAITADMPQAVAQIVGNERTEPHSTVSSYGGIGGGHMAMHHGQGGKKDEINADAERFFRAVDRAVLAHSSHLSALPLMLAALPEHQHLFRAVSHNSLLMADGVIVDPQSLTVEELCKRAWHVVAPEQQAQQAEWCESYAAASSRGLGSEDLSQVAHAAVAGRVATLLIEAERQVAGRIDGSTGRIDPSDMASPRADDVLDDLGALVESMGGQVHVLPAERMPSSTGVAASFRH